MPRRTTEHAQLEARRRERDPGGGAYVDIRIDVEFDGETFLSCGGRWDRRLGDYDGEAQTAIVLEPHAGQMRSVEWFKGWLAVHAGRRDDPPRFDEAALAQLEAGLVQEDEVYSALLAGGRRGGKTWIAAYICVAYAVQFPDAIVWIVNPNDTKHDEVRRYISPIMSPDWIARETYADGWELVNGSALMLKSAYAGTDPDAIKEGEAHLVWMNEGQKMKKRVYVVARGAIADHSGLVLVCANPPVESKDEQWVSDFASDAQNGRQLSMYQHFNPVDNPHINRLALLSLKREVDIRTYRIEVLGEFLPPAGTVAYNWIRTKDGNERARPGPDDPNWVDVTTEFLLYEEEGEELRDLVGMDFQVHPWMGGPVLRVYAPRGKQWTRENVVLWGVDEIVIEGDEAEWSHYAKVEKKYNPNSTLIVGDATGEYQHSRRSSTDSPPPEWSGRGSYDILRDNGFWRVVPPSRRMRRKNPDVRDRVRAFTSMIDVLGTRRLFMDPDRCPKTCKSIREWPNVHGKPSRIHEAAHLGDGVSYPIIRLFPRVLRSEKPDPVDPRPNDRQEAPRSKFLGPPPRATPRDRKRSL